jgi:hypothetical protein
MGNENITTEKNENVLVVEKARETARLYLRGLLISEAKDKILTLNIKKKSAESYLASYNKSNAVCDFKISQINDADPEKEDKIKAAEDTKKKNNEHLELYTKEVACMDREIAKVEEEIKKIASGEVKVNAEELYSISNTYISEYYKAQMRAFTA